MDSETRHIPPDDDYTWSRSRERERAQCVFEVAYLLDKQPLLIHTTPSIASLLEVPIIEGYNKLFHKTTLSELLDTNLAQLWGPLIGVCCRPRPPDVTNDRLIFMLGVLAFGPSDMGILRTIIALPFSQELPSPPASGHT